MHQASHQLMHQVSHQLMHQPRHQPRHQPTQPERQPRHHPTVPRHGSDAEKKATLHVAKAPAVALAALHTSNVNQLRANGDVSVRMSQSVELLVTTKKNGINHYTTF